MINKHRARLVSCPYRSWPVWFALLVQRRKHPLPPFVKGLYPVITPLRNELSELALRHHRRGIAAVKVRELTAEEALRLYDLDYKGPSS